MIYFLNSIPSGGNNSIIADWNFTESLVDSINGYSITLDSATRDSEGLHINDDYGVGKLPILVSGCMFYELELGDYTALSNGDIFYIDRSSRNAIGYDGNTWKLNWFNSVFNSGITDINFFRNSMLKFYIDKDRKAKVYKNSDLIIQSNNSMQGTNVTFYPIPSDITIGDSLYGSLKGLIVKSLKIGFENI